MKRIVLGLFFGAICLLPIVTAISAEGISPKKLKPCVIITGVDSHVLTTRYQRITSNEEWKRAWQEHKGAKTTVPEDFSREPLTLPWIDFDDYMVIAIFQGKGFNNRGLNCLSIVEENDRIVFKFKNS